MKKLSISMVTIGEPETLESLDRFIKYTPKNDFDLTIWYDTKGKEIDIDFYHEIKKRTTDVIVSCKDRGPQNACRFAMMALDAEFIMLPAVDHFVNDDYYEKLMLPFNNEKVAVCGESYNQYGSYSVSNDDLDLVSDFPDHLITIRMKAVNEVGSFSPSFQFYSHDTIELFGRFYKAGWLIALVPNLIDRNKLVQNIFSNKNLEEIKIENEKLFNKLRRLDFKGYNWWSKDLKDVFVPKNEDELDLKTKEMACEFLGITPDESMSERFNYIFNQTCSIGKLMVKLILNGKLKNVKTEEHYNELSHGDKELFFLGSLVKLRSERDKLR